MTPYWTVPRIWEGRTVAVLASGPSMSLAAAERVAHLPRVAVNTTYLLAPDADVIYASDSKWWQAHPEALDCPGVKASIEHRPGTAPADMPEGVVVLRNTGRDGFDADPAAARTCNNSGAVALQVAIHGGAARVLLLGLDLHGGHWHGDHPKGLGNPSPAFLARCVVRFRSLARSLPASVEVLNCSPSSALDCFRKVSLTEALQ